MWPLKTILYFGVFWVGCFAAMFNPIWGVVNYMIAYQFHPPGTWWGKPLADIGLRFSLLAAGFTILGLFFGRRQVPDGKRGFSLWELSVFGLIFIAALNVLLGVGYGPSAQYAFEKFWKLQVFVLILARLGTTRRNLKLVIWAIVVGNLYIGYDAFTAPQWRFALGRLDTLGGSDISTSSGAAAHLAAMLPIGGVAVLTAYRWRWKIFAAISSALTFNAIVLCRTRSAFLGLVAGAAVAIVTVPKARRFRIYVLLIIGAIGAMRLADANYWERMSTLTDVEGLKHEPATVGRTDIWKASVHLLADYPTGVGLGNFINVIGRYDHRYYRRSPHNTIVMCFCELGVFGGGLFLAMIAGSVACTYRSAKLAHLTQDPLETKLFAYGFLISIVVYFVAGLGTERFSCESFWWVLVLPQCLYRLVLNEVTAPACEVEPVREPVPVAADYYGGLQYAM